MGTGRGGDARTSSSPSASTTLDELEEKPFRASDFTAAFPPRPVPLDAERAVGGGYGGGGGGGGSVPSTSYTGAGAASAGGGLGVSALLPSPRCAAGEAGEGGFHESNFSYAI